MNSFCLFSASYCRGGIKDSLRCFLDQWVLIRVPNGSRGKGRGRRSQRWQSLSSPLSTYLILVKVCAFYITVTFYSIKERTGFAPEEAHGQDFTLIVLTMMDFFFSFSPGIIRSVMLLIEFWPQPTSSLPSALKLPATSLPSSTEGEWETSTFQGAWLEGSTAGGSRNFLSHWQNPNFPLTVCDGSSATSGVNVRITLQQNRPDTNLLPIGFHIYKVI